ncbi:MAG: pitrilysin family protein, partial [Bacteroidota bacterium]
MIDSSISHQFETFSNDIFDVKKYTLKNGLQLFLSVNKDEPRILTNVIVRAGSKQDPPSTTGLAHYMEHMLFKGTSKIGTTNWEKEKELLQKISDLFESHRKTNDAEEKKKIYKQIDETSYEAAKLVAPNEYDKLVTSIGAQKTNAYTWIEQTVYINEIPTNELERWMMLESERFRMMALRLFHTELETVYEEFNITQDNDYRKANKILRSNLFPSHPYGTQTTIGEPEHLKNPSQVNIQNYFTTYYVPNNMAIVMAGDLDLDQAVEFAEKYFGDYQKADFPPFTYEDQASIEDVIRKEVKGKESAFVQMGWRFPGGKTKEALKMLLLSSILFNEKAGLIDIHLAQPQRILDSIAYPLLQEDYSILMLYGRPRENQTLAEVEKLLYAQIEKLRNGEFEDWLLEAIINDMMLERQKALESNAARVNALTTCYVLGLSWDEYIQQIDNLKQLSKADVVAFAQEHMHENYVVVHKNQGVDENVVKVDKPDITAVPLNRSAVSDFAKSFFTHKTPALKPEFLDYSAIISSNQLKGGIQLDYVQNPHKSPFRLDFIFEMGKSNDLYLPLMLTYLPYLGTDQYSPTEIQQKLYRLGLSLDYYVGQERSYVSITGLEQSMEDGLELLEHLLANAKPNPTALNNVISDILTRRANSKQDRNFIQRTALMNFAQYASSSPLSFKLKAEDLKQVSPELLIQKIRLLTSYDHHIYYYGQKSQNEVSAILEKLHRIPDQLKPIPQAHTFEQLDTNENQVFILDFPIVQTDILMLSKGTPQYNLQEDLMSKFYNDYFGYGEIKDEHLIFIGIQLL